MRWFWLPLLLLGIEGEVDAQPSAEPEAVASLPTDAELRTFLNDPSTTAAQAYDLGARFFEARRYETAETAWLRAYALGREPRLLLAIADTRQRRGDEPGAVAMLEQYLLERPDAPDRAPIEARIATLLQSPAVLIVRTEQPGRAILLDGVPVGKKTPAELDVRPGSHTIVVAGEGRQLDEQTVQLGYGERKELDLTPDTKSKLTVEQSEEAKVAARLATENEDRTMRRAVIATGSLAAASLITGTVLGFLALRQDQRYRNDPSVATADKGERQALFADLSFGLAALTAITSFTLFMTHKNKRKRERERASLRIETRGAGVTARLGF